jgi:hypothetical protein
MIYWGGQEVGNSAIPRVLPIGPNFGLKTPVKIMVKIEGLKPLE